MADKPYFRRVRVPLAANGHRKVAVRGEYFAVLGSTGDFAIGIEDQALSDWAPGLKIGGDADADGRARSFRYLQVQDISGAPNVIDLVIGGGGFNDARLTVSGTVDVQGTTGGLAIPTEQNVHQDTYTILASAGAVALLGSAVQLLNPPASGRLLFVDELSILSAQAAVRGLHHDVAITAIHGFARVDRRASAAVAEVRSDAFALLAGPYLFEREPTNRVSYRPPRAFVLDQGQGLVVQGTAANVAVECTFFWREVPV